MLEKKKMRKVLSVLLAFFSAFSMMLVNFSGVPEVKAASSVSSYIPWENLAGFSLGGAGLTVTDESEGFRITTTTRSGNSFEASPTSFWSGVSEGSNVAGGNRSVFMRVEIPAEVTSPALIDSFTVTLTAFYQHNYSQGPVRLTLFALNNALPADMSSLRVNASATFMGTGTSQYACKSTDGRVANATDAVASNTLTSSGKTSASATDATSINFDIADWAKSNWSHIRVVGGKNYFEFIVLPSCNGLDIYGPAASVAENRPRYTVEWSDPSETLTIPNQLSDGYQLPTTCKDIDVTWSSSNESVLNGSTIVSQPTQQTVTLTAYIEGYGQKEFPGITILAANNPIPANAFYSDARFDQSALIGGSELSASAYMTNAAETDLGLIMIQALYSDNGAKLVQIETKRAEIPAYSTAVESVSLTLPATLPNNPLVKLFLFDDGFVPRAPAVVFDGAVNGGGWSADMTDDWTALELSQPAGSVLIAALSSPAAFGGNGSQIGWSSTNPDILLTTGSIVPAAQDYTGALVAAIANDGDSFTKAFKYTVAAPGSEAYMVMKTLDEITLEYDTNPDTPVYENYAFDAALTTVSNYGATIVWSSSDPTAMSDSGENLVTDAATHPVTMTVTVTLGSFSVSKSWQLDVIKRQMSAYLFAYFYGNDSGEVMKLGISKDAYQWRDLGMVSSVDADFTPTEGSGHVRDPFIIKGVDPEGNQKYYMLATDLRAEALNPNNCNDLKVTTSTSNYQNRAIYTWESDDLINWSVATRIRIADMGSLYPFTAGSGCAWAPEAVWVADHVNPDESVGAYMMYFTTNRNNQNETTTYSVTTGNVLAYWFTRDFKTFEGTPQYLFSHSGNLTGSNAPYSSSSQSMDGSIISYELEGTTYYCLFYRKDGGGIYRIGPQRSATSWSGTGTAVIGETTEGPEAFQLIGETGTNGWMVFADHFGGTTRFAAYKPTDVSTFTTSNNNELDRTTVTNINSFTSSGRARHGGFITIDEARYQALCKAYGLTP